MTDSKLREFASAHIARQQSEIKHSKCIKRGELYRDCGFIVQQRAVPWLQLSIQKPCYVQSAQSLRYGIMTDSGGMIDNQEDSKVIPKEA